MAEYSIQSETLTSIGDEIRTISGISTELKTSEMIAHLTAANANVTSEAELIGQIVNTLIEKSAIQGYVMTEAEAVALAIDQRQSNDSIVFPVFADAHCGFYTDTANAAVNLAGQLTSEIGKRVSFDFVAHLGDYSTGAWDTTRDSTMTDIEDYAALLGSKNPGTPAIWVPGNHDDAPYRATADRMTQADVFRMIGRKSRIGGALCPDGCNYGYLDLDNRNLRVIYLDTDDKRGWSTVDVGSGEEGPAYLNAHNIGAAQLAWLAGTALDFSTKADPSKWSVVVLSHVALNVTGTITDATGTTYTHSTANAATILNAYMTGSSGSISHDATITYDFSNVESRAVIVCCVHGHEHRLTSSTVGGIVSIGCPNIMNGRERASDDGVTYSKTAGTVNGTSFCIITVDREVMKIYADCVGAGYDREFVYSTTIASYTNQIPISTDTDGSVYNGVGYREGYRLSSSGELSSTSGMYVTGFIPAVNTDDVYLKNVTHNRNASDASTQRIAFYDASKTFMFVVGAQSYAAIGKIHDSDGNLIQFKVENYSDYDASNVAFFRICASYIGADSVITVNEPIE